MLKPAMIALAVMFACLGVLPADAQGKPGMRNGLPPTRMDSFVANAGASADLIYGDEGTDTYPPYFGFTYEHRINAGITGIRDAGLTTGHGSYMPCANGADEFIAPGNPGGEWSRSGANYGNPQDNGANLTYDLSVLNSASNLMMQAQNDLKAAQIAANQPWLTPAQRSAAQAGIQAAQQNIAALQNAMP
jgi:hypothetical protein